MKTQSFKLLETLSTNNTQLETNSFLKLQLESPDTGCFNAIQNNFVFSNEIKGGKVATRFLKRNFLYYDKFYTEKLYNERDQESLVMNIVVIA